MFVKTEENLCKQDEKAEFCELSDIQTVGTRFPQIWIGDHCFLIVL